MFWCVLYRFGAFATIWLPCETRGETFRASAKVCAMKSRQNFAQERTRSTRLDPKLLFCYVLYHLGAFGTVKLPYETRGKMFRTSAKVDATKLHRIISQGTTLDPKLMF